MSVDAQFYVIDVFTRAMLGELDLTDVEFSDPLRDNGRMTAQIPVESREHANELKPLLRKDASAVIVVFNDSNAVAEWGGILTYAEWDPIDKTVKVEWDHYRQWFYTRLITPSVNNVPRDAYFTLTNTEQASIFSYMVAYALDCGLDAPYIAVDAPATGKARDTSAKSTDFRNVGDAIDTVANRTNGFDWTVEIRMVGGLYTPTAVIYYPERISRDGTYPLTLSYVDMPNGNNGGNIQTYKMPESVVDRVSRMWATGEGSPPDMVMSNAASVWDQTRTYVYREAKRAYSSVSEQTTLNSHARAEIRERETLTSLCSVTVYLDNPDITRYRTGDRARLLIQDEWTDIDLPSVRIMSVTVHVNGTEVPYATLLLDITDAYGSLAEDD